MKRVLTSTLILMVLLAAAPPPAHAQTELPPGSLSQSKNTLITKFTKLGYAFGKSHATGNGFAYDGVNAATQSIINIVTVKTGIAFVRVKVTGVIGAAADAPENHLADVQKVLKTVLPNWKDGPTWLQAAQGIVVADANGGVDSAQKEAVEQVETPLLYITYENALQKESNTVSFSLTVFNVAQVATLEMPTADAAAPVVALAAGPEPTAAPVAPVALVAQPAQPAQPASAQPASAQPAQVAAGCDPSYPTLCIPIGGPDLDCPDISERRFPVLPPDRHRFDGDHDGIGCEK